LQLTGACLQIPAAWVIAFLPHAYAAAQSKIFDNRSPRTYASLLEKDQTIDKAVSLLAILIRSLSNSTLLTAEQTKARILRCEGAQTNGFENPGLFATAVLAGNLAGLPAQTLNTLSGGYCLRRIVYNFIYINNTSEAMANTRTMVFLAGIGQIFTLFIQSGNILRGKAANLL
jgi:uncharacterized MAPEG superfamily protein